MKSYCPTVSFVRLAPGLSACAGACTQARRKPHPHRRQMTKSLDNNTLFYDISVTELNSLTLVSLSQGYASALTDALRASYVTAATYGYAALPLQTVLSFGIGAVGWLLWSVVMLKGSIFPRWMAISGIIINVIGIIGAAAPVVPASFILGLFQFLAVPLTGLWFIIIGVRLYRSSQKHQLVPMPHVA